MMSGVVGFSCVIAFDPVEILWYNNALFIGYLLAADLNDSFADINAGVDGLCCDDDIVNFEW